MAADGHHRGLAGAYREQTVEIGLGPKGAFKNGNVGAVTPCVAADLIVSALPDPRDRPNPQGAQDATGGRTPPQGPRVAGPP